MNIGAHRIHAWGDTLTEAFEQCANAMFHYMTEVDYIEMKESFDIEVEGHDMMSLLYNFLDELLFTFSAEPYYIARVSNRVKFFFFFFFHFFVCNSLLLSCTQLL